MTKTRKLHPADEYVTRAECMAYINHALNRLLREMLAPAPEPDDHVGLITPTGAPLTTTTPGNTFTLGGTPCG